MAGPRPGHPGQRVSHHFLDGRVKPAHGEQLYRPSMKLALPQPSGGYDPGNEAQARALIEQADAQNIKRQDVLTSLKFRDTATGAVKTITIHSGAVVIT